MHTARNARRMDASERNIRSVQQSMDALTTAVSTMINHQLATLSSDNDHGQRHIAPSSYSRQEPAQQQQQQQQQQQDEQKQQEEVRLESGLPASARNCGQPTLAETTKLTLGHPATEKASLDIGQPGRHIEMRQRTQQSAATSVLQALHRATQPLPTEQNNRGTALPPGNRILKGSSAVDLSLRRTTHVRYRGSNSDFTK